MTLALRERSEAITSNLETIRKQITQLTAVHQTSAAITSTLDLHELMDTVGFMVKQGYIAMEEVPGIPTLNKSPAVVAYAPIEQATFTPDVVVIAARPGQLMLVQEAAIRSGAGNGLAVSSARV